MGYIPQQFQNGIFWLILTVFLEARNQSVTGQKNVAIVIMNRADSKNWELSDIVNARKQFSCYNDGLPKALMVLTKDLKSVPKVTNNVIEAIYDWSEGYNLQGATHYFNPNPKLVPGGWPSGWDRSKMIVVAKEGDHIFLREI
jgi:spore germination cell wall hydrolase CwlJ-like protein